MCIGLLQVELCCIFTGLTKAFCISFFFFCMKLTFYKRDIFICQQNVTSVVDEMLLFLKS